MTKFWKNYWQSADLLRKSHPQHQVGRTINKAPIAQHQWEETLDFLAAYLAPTTNDVLLDLCAGNGLLSVFFAERVQRVVAVDISADLLNRIDTQAYSNIKTIHSDVLALKLPGASFDKALMYFSLQHFSLKETILMLKAVHHILKPGGVFYIGDIPDAARIWVFFNDQDRENAFFKSILSEKPIIGQWFDKKFVEKASRFAGFSDVKMICQPEYQINSRYRFDVLLKK